MELNADLVCQLYEGGQNTKQIAKLFGSYHQKVTKILHQQGIPIRKRVSVYRCRAKRPEDKVTPRKRFDAGFDIREDGCWIWRGSKNSNGYGKFAIDKRTIYVHRYSYELFKAPIPPGLTIDHLCRNRACCNPVHLEAVTHLENVRRRPARAQVSA